MRLELGPVGTAARRTVACTWPADDAHLAGRELACEVELVRREQHRAAVGRRGAHDVVEHVAALLVEPGVRLVEQEQARLARERDSRATTPPALPLRQPAVRDVGDAVAARRRSTRGVGVGGRRPAARAAKRTFSATVRSS